MSLTKKKIGDRKGQVNAFEDGACSAKVSKQNAEVNIQHLNVKKLMEAVEIFKFVASKIKVENSCEEEAVCKEVINETVKTEFIKIEKIDGNSIKAVNHHYVGSS